MLTHSHRKNHLNLWHELQKRICCEGSTVLSSPLLQDSHHFKRKTPEINYPTFVSKACVLSKCIDTFKNSLRGILHAEYLKMMKSCFQFSSVAQLCLTLCNPMNCSTPGLPVHHQLPESTQTHVHWVDDAIQPSHPLLSPSLPTLSLSQHQGLFQWVSSSHEVAKVLEFQLQHQSFQWTPKTLKSLLQHHYSKASILRCSALFIVQLSHKFFSLSNPFIYHFMSVVYSYFYLFCQFPFLCLECACLLATWVSGSSLLRVCNSCVHSISKCVLSKTLTVQAPLSMAFSSRKILVSYSPWGRRVGHDWVTSLSLSHVSKTQELQWWDWELFGILRPSLREVCF